MAEQISRRANAVTGSRFEGPFENHQVRYGRGTLNLKDSLDAMEGWSRLTNVWHENEGEATARPGLTPVATHSGGTCHAIRALYGANPTRFWGIDTTVQRGATGPTSAVDTGYSGDPLTFVPHRPALSGHPWMYVADRNRMRKIRDDGLSLPIGLPAPGAAPSVTLGPEYRTSIATFSAADGTEASGWTMVPGTMQPTPEEEATIPPPAPVPTDPPLAVDEFSIPGGATPDIYITVNAAGGLESFTGYDSWIATTTPCDLSQLTPVGGGASIPAGDDDLIHFWIKTSHPDQIEEIRLYLVCTPTFGATPLPGLPDGAGANADAYVKAFRQGDFVKFIQAKETAIESAETARIYALRDGDLKARAMTADDRKSWEETRASQDPGRAQSIQIGSGQQQWVEMSSIGVPVRRGDFQRIGNSAGCDWSTITGTIVYIRVNSGPCAVGIGDLYLTGGSGPMTGAVGSQPYDYRVTHYDPRTGAESNGSPVYDKSLYVDPLRRRVLIDPAAHGDAAIRQRVYRRGGSLYDDWYFVGENTSDGAVFTDTEHDFGIVGAGTLPIDHYQPIPTVDAAGNTVLNQPLPAIWGPLEGMIVGCGDPHRPGHLYFSHAHQPEHWSAAGNVEVCAPSEALMHGGVAANQGFVFSRARLYALYPNLSGGEGITATPTRCTRGLLGRWAFCVGPGGVIYFVAEDGIFVTGGGPEEWLSEAINPLFYGTAVNGYEPIDKTQAHLLRLTVWENALYFLYQDTEGDRQVLVYSILNKFWRHYHFGRALACVQGEDEPLLLLGGDGTGASYTHSGLSDDGTAIDCVIRTGSASGAIREEKLFGDLFLDCDPAGVDLTLQVFLNEEAHANVEELVATETAGRQRFIVHAFGAAPQKAHSIAVELRWSSDEGRPILYQIGYAVTLQPDLTNTRVTNWDDLNSADEVWLTGVTFDCDTGGVAKTVYIERDFAGERTTVATLDVVSANRHKFKYSWPAVPAHQVRIRPDGVGCVPWLLYRADWIYVQEPPRISKWDIHFENQWDQYYTGLDLYCDTFGQEKRVEVYVDEVRLTNALGGGLTYWPIVANGRRVVHLTLPWGRGHVFRFKAIDDHEGLLYTHRWHLQEEPSEQANWNQNFSILGTHADKWLKAIIFECDTFGVDKQVQVEVDGTAVETLTINCSGRRVIQRALTQQRLGRVWRMYPVDANPGRLYTAEPLFDEEPFQLDRWETQETNHGLPGWFYPLYAHITLKSTADVTLTTLVQHNQVGGTTTRTYTIPATGGQKQRRFLNGFHAGKGVLIKYILTSPQPFFLYRDETVLFIQPWGAYEAIPVTPFGNDDLDPSRPMTHAVLAAQTSGGTLTPGALGGQG